MYLRSQTRSCFGFIWNFCSMKMIDFLEMIFPRHGDVSSRKRVKERLHNILAHDRATVTPDIIASMRRDILEVVARYVDVDMNEMEFGLENSDRMTSVIANMPIRQVKRAAPTPQEKQAQAELKLPSDDLLEL